MKLKRKYIICLSTFIYLLLTSSASYAIEIGQCNVADVGNLQGINNLTIKFDNDGTDSTLNDRGASDTIITTNSSQRVAVSGGNFKLFCRCESDVGSGYQYQYKIELEGDPIIRSTIDYDGYTYKFIDVDPSYPFEVGTTVVIGSHVPVPNYYMKGNASCDATDTSLTESGQVSSGATAGGIAKLVFRMKSGEAATPGLYSFTFPTIKVYRNYGKTGSSTAETANYTSTPMIQLVFNVIEAYVYNSCELEQSIVTVDLGALSSNEFTTDGAMPIDYEKRTVNLNFTCGGTDQDQADFFITDSFDPANVGNYLTTDLPGVGVAIDALNTTTPGRVDMGKRYENVMPITNNVGLLQLQVYPIKTTDNVATGIYRGKANIVIENY